MTAHTTVAVLPAKFRVAKRRAPSGLVASGLPTHLQVAVQQHPHAGGPQAVATADKAPAGVDHKGAVALGDAGLDRLTAAPGLGARKAGQCSSPAMDQVRLGRRADLGLGDTWRALHQP
jgi:hypothetical protein